MIDVADFTTVKRFLDSNHIQTLECIFITHSHADHSKGIATLIDRFKKEGKEVKKLFFTPDRFNHGNEQSKYKKLIRNLVSIINNQKVESVSPVIKGIEEVIYYDNEIKLKISILYPDNADLMNAFDRNNCNDASTVVEVVYNGYKVLLPGDLEARGWKRLYNRYTANGLIGNWDVLKLPHHGDYYTAANGEEMDTPKVIDFVAPQIGIISSGPNEVYKHPEAKTIEILKRKGIEIYCTQVTDICECERNAVRENAAILLGKDSKMLLDGCPCSGDIIITISDTIRIEPTKVTMAKVKSLFKTPQCI